MLEDADESLIGQAERPAPHAGVGETAGIRLAGLCPLAGAANQAIMNLVHGLFERLANPAQAIEEDDFFRQWCRNEFQAEFEKAARVATLVLARQFPPAPVGTAPGNAPVIHVRSDVPVDEFSRLAHQTKIRRLELTLAGLDRQAPESAGVQEALDKERTALARLQAQLRTEVAARIYADSLREDLDGFWRIACAYCLHHLGRASAGDLAALPTRLMRSLEAGISIFPPGIGLNHTATMSQDEQPWAAVSAQTEAEVFHDSLEPLASRFLPPDHAALVINEHFVSPAAAHQTFSDMATLSSALGKHYMLCNAGRPDPHQSPSTAQIVAWAMGHRHNPRTTEKAGLSLTTGEAFDLDLTCDPRIAVFFARTTQQLRAAYAATANCSITVQPTRTAQPAYGWDRRAPKPLLWSCIGYLECAVYCTVVDSYLSRTGYSARIAGRAANAPGPRPSTDEAQAWLARKRLPPERTDLSGSAQAARSPVSGSRPPSPTHRSGGKRTGARLTRVDMLSQFALSVRPRYELNQNHLHRSFRLISGRPAANPQAAILVLDLLMFERIGHQYRPIPTWHEQLDEATTECIFGDDSFINLDDDEFGDLMLEMTDWTVEVDGPVLRLVGVINPPIASRRTDPAPF